MYIEDTIMKYITLYANFLKLFLKTYNFPSNFKSDLSASSLKREKYLLITMENKSFYITIQFLPNGYGSFFLPLCY